MDIGRVVDETVTRLRAPIDKAHATVRKLKSRVRLLTVAVALLLAMQIASLAGLAAIYVRLAG
jgi:hypothetical protein